jgi:four helix bundle protein
MERSAISIPSNIAEGAARHSRKEYKHFLHISRGSIGELDAQLEIAKTLKLLNKKDYQELMDRLNEIGRMLTGLLKSL